MDVNTVDINCYKIISKIGEGGFGEVFKVKEKQSGHIYAAKISLKSIEDNSMLLISREVNILSAINHPFIVKFIGFSSVNFHKEPKPVIITEYLSNGSLEDIISLERRSLATFNWNDTRKHINIYGIASSMLYLHRHKIVHRDLKPANILMDDFLCPKIADFGLSKIQHSPSSKITIDSSISVKGTPAYMSPEIWTDMKYTTASDVYAFGVIVYELFSNERPFNNLNFFQIRSKVINGRRPAMGKLIPDNYRSLIEKCWSQEAKNRPSFKEIVNLLKTDEFTANLVDKEDFFDFVEYVDNYKTFFDPNKRIISIDKFIKRKSKTFQRVSIKNECSVPKRKTLYPLKEYVKLDKECKKLVDEAENDSDKQFQVGFCLIEGEQNFPIRTEIGIMYLKESIRKDNVDAAVYYSRMLIKAELVPRDLECAEEILNKYSLKESPEIPLLFGLIKKKKKDFSNAIKFFEMASKAGNGEGQYQYGKLLYEGRGCISNKQEAMKLFAMSKKNGFNKSDKYLSNQKKPSETSVNKQKKDESNSEKIKQRSINDDSESLFKKAVNYYNNSNKKLAIQFYKLAIEKGHVGAMNNYATMLHDGDGVSMNKEEAINYYKLGIKKGDSNSMCNYAIMLQNGDGVTMNKSKAAHYYKKAIDKGHCIAMLNYANMLSKGEGVSVNKQESVEYYKMAVKKGETNSLYNYACMLYEGDGIQMNKGKAAKYFKMAIDKGDVGSLFVYAMMLKNGDGIKMNKKESIKYLKMAIEKGDTDAMCIYAKMLNKGDGITINKKEAKKYFKMAIDKGNVDAIFNYAMMLKNENAINNNEAIKYFKMAIDKGDSDAMHVYAKMLMNGFVITMKSREEIEEEAIAYLKTAIKKGNSTAMFNYANMLYEGNGVTANKEKAAHYYKMAIQSGNKNASYFLAVMLDKGDGVPMNKKESIKYYKMSINKGNSDAMLNYADMLFNGDGIDANKEKAAHYYKMAADKKNNFALLKYAEMLENDDGIEKNTKQANIYYEEYWSQKRQRITLILKSDY